MSWRRLWRKAGALDAKLLEDCGRLLAPCALLYQLQCKQNTTSAATEMDSETATAASEIPDATRRDSGSALHCGTLGNPVGRKTYP